MGKEGELWDDSALINAFDHAISTYKKMHNKNKNKSKDDSVEAEVEAEAEGETVMGATSEENGRNLDTARDVDEKSNIAATDTSNLGETSSVPILGDNHHAESQVEQTCQDSTSGQGITNELAGYAYEQGVDEYNQLVSQYNELEEKRLKIWEQLNQFGAWNYQYDATATSAGVPYSNAQDYSMSPYQVSDPSVVCTCCPCFSQCSMAPCTTAPGYSVDESGIGKPCNSHHAEMDRKMPFPCEDGKIHKIAMGAAEKALSSVRTTISGDSNVNEEKERTISEPKQTSGSGTDLTAVLNAWYSAGFYTGKYLAEQSMANQR
ncbi:hypothetical protein PIB30_022395 [Stylosanthes scabra]|uniref:Survival Motor Neuron Gemin2-binding domain-containing protein n=1 Tax=Stylosanthes scabra TaxID=79078 RepID=A0ABU6Y9K8_9FABA|nr:hypothetical protein [Stylosanthes scabra]